MRVLLTTPYDLDVPGGVNRHARGLLAALEGRGVEAKLLGPSSGFGGPPEASVVRVGRVKVGSFNGAKSRVTLDLGIAGAVRRIMVSFKPDVVHLHEPFLPTLNTFVLLNAGRARRVGTFHTFSETSRGYLWFWPWCRWVSSRLDARVAVSQAAERFAARYHPAPFERIEHAIRLPEPGAARGDRPPGRPVRLLFVGRADEPRKGFSILLAAMEMLEAADPGAYVLEAVGPNTPGGRVSEEELAERYRTADLCIVPSLGGESFGLVALEALAHGVPVVASRIAGYREWLEAADVGGLVPPADPLALATRVRALCGDEGAYRACADRARRVAATYSWEACTDRLLAVYSGGRG